MYDEKNLRKLLSRALEIQRRSGQSDSLIGSSEKLSLEEVERIARESGLSPEFIKQAAVELEGVPVEEPFFIDTGNKFEVEILGLAEGDIDQKSWAELRSIIETDLKSKGTVKRHPDKIVWLAEPVGFRKLLSSVKTSRVEIKKSGYKSYIRIKKNLNKYKILQYPAYAGYGGSFMFIPILFETGDPSLLIVIAGLSGVSKLLLSWRDRLIEKSKEKLKGTITQLQTIMNRRNTASERRSEPDEKISLEGRSGGSEDESFRSEKTRVR